MFAVVVVEVVVVFVVEVGGHWWDLLVEVGEIHRWAVAFDTGESDKHRER